MVDGEVPVREAATVMIVRDASEPPGCEVVLLRRSLTASFVSGAYVFPGGVVDPDDRRSEWNDRVVGLNDEEASSAIGLDNGGLSFWVAAVREAFEESGLLLAVKAETLEWLSAAEMASKVFADARRAVHDGHQPFFEVLSEFGLVIDSARVRPWSRWVTPIGSNRRYDTRFFVAEAPPWAEPFHDEHETIASEWARPCDALERSRRGEIQLIFPTVKSLEALSRTQTANEALCSRRRFDLAR